MPERSPNYRQLCRLALGLLCCLLVASVGFVQIGHAHTTAHPSSDCALCHTAHAVAQPAIVQGVLPSASLICTLAVAAPQLRIRRRLFFSLYTRPPPVGITVS
jgi:hypothetical protein